MYLIFFQLCVLNWRIRHSNDHWRLRSRWFPDKSYPVSRERISTISSQPPPWKIWPRLWPIFHFWQLHCTKLSIVERMVIFKLFIQVYIVSGGWTGSSTLASTETLEKDGGSAWEQVASLPSERYAVRGLGLDHGRFMVTGECWIINNIVHWIIITPDTLALQVATLTGMRYSCTTLKRTSGPQ